MNAEIIDGELLTQPRPAVRHSGATSRLGMKLGGPFDLGNDGPGGWLLLDEPELHLSDDVVVPDLAGWRRQRMPELPDTAAITLPPDWICETLSPSTQGIDRVEKMALYAGESGPCVWHLDPLARTLEVFRREGRTEGVTRGDLQVDALVYARARDKGDKSLEVYKFLVNDPPRRAHSSDGYRLPRGVRYGASAAGAPERGVRGKRLGHRGEGVVPG